MREIKFRAWDNQLKAMVQVDHQHQLNIRENHWEITDLVIGCKVMDNWRGNDKGNILMQYTGLHDKNGREIYEGDIVAGYKGYFVHNVIGVVKYCGLSFVFEGTTEENRYDISGGKGDNYWRYTVTNPSVKELPEIEVIGNIYENPELLTPPKEIS